MIRSLSPTERERIAPWFDGPQTGEDRNAWLARMNSVLTERDRQWILEFTDAFNAGEFSK